RLGPILGETATRKLVEGSQPVHRHLPRRTALPCSFVLAPCRAPNPSSPLLSSTTLRQASENRAGGSHNGQANGHPHRRTGADHPCRISAWRCVRCPSPRRSL